MSVKSEVWAISELMVGKSVTETTDESFPSLDGGLVPQSCVICDPMDCSPPGSSVLGVLQARILEWVAMSLSRGPSRPRDRTHISCISGRFFTD